jgi:DNA polymerase-3 subunit alpha (Gram-positive type)
MENNHGPSNTLIRNLSFCVFDLETTGGNHQSDKIIEIGLVKLEGLEIIAEKSFLVNPEIKIPDFIQKLTSIQPEDVKGAPVIEDVIYEILEFMSDSILVAHNTSFDIPFFNSVLKRLSIPPLENKSICTNLMTKNLIPNLMNSNLTYMGQIFGIPHKNAHRALDDAKATANLLIKYLHFFIKNDIKKINHLYYPRNRFELDRKNIIDNSLSREEYKKLFLEVSNPYLLSIKGENGIILFSLPANNSNEELNYILDTVMKKNWTSITIKLFGSFLESLINFNTLYNKLPEATRQDVLSFLNTHHLKNQFNKSHSDVAERYDFLITNHIVPEQYIIFSLSKIHHKKGLIFRYPSHSKKLFNYIKGYNSRSKKKTFKGSKDLIGPCLREFIMNYIYKLDDSKEKKDVFLFDSQFFLKQKKLFTDELMSFLAKNPNTYHYPQKYI